MWNTCKQLLSRLFSRKKSREIARKRLLEVLSADRAEQSLPFFTRLREDIAEILKKYADFNAFELSLQISRQPAEGTVCLMANVPIFTFHEPVSL